MSYARDGYSQSLGPAVFYSARNSFLVLPGTVLSTRHLQEVPFYFRCERAKGRLVSFSRADADAGSLYRLDYRCFTLFQSCIRRYRLLEPIPNLTGICRGNERMSHELDR
jgi:hypothetical protein